MRKKTTKEFIKEAKEIHGDKYDYSLVEYDGSLVKIKIICKKHGVFEQKPQDHIRFNCPSCSNKKKKTTVSFIKESKEVHGDKYDYSLVKYKNNKAKVKIICKNHGVFEQVSKDHLSGRNCRKCMNEKYESKGEKKIREILESHNITFISQHKFEDCKNIKKLPFDFYLPELNSCIEFDGRQHFESIHLWGGEEYLLKIQQNDNIKTRYCNINGIDLTRIPHNQFEKIEEILGESCGF